MPKDDTIVCPVCEVAMRSITASHFRKHGFTSAESFKQATGLTYLVCAAKRHKHQQMMLANNPMQGKEHSTQAVDLMSRHRTGKGLGVAGKYQRTAEIREKISVSLTETMIRHGHGRRERVFCEKADQKVWVRSSWEKRVIAVVDLHPCVQEVTVEPFSIPYMFEGLRKRYVPDLLLLMEGGYYELWEIKPHQMCNGQSLTARKNRIKLKVLREYGLTNRMNTRWVDLEHIEGMESQVGLREWTAPGKPWVDLTNPDVRPTNGETHVP
jgi:hypothetical protein